MTKPVAPLSLDLDNKWSYLKTHGDSSWQSFPSYINVVVPRALASLEDLDLRITFFLVGKDATEPAHKDLLAEIAGRGHEIGNHSFMHEPWLHLYHRTELREDLVRAHEAIHSATGVEPKGFRGPGFSLSVDTIEELSGLRYSYDATVFPNVLNPLGRYYYFMKSNLTKEERRQRQALFGTLSDATRPVHPFMWRSGDIELPEVPVTTIPLIRTPFHFSYLIFLAKYSERLATAYLRFALAVCRLRGLAPSLLLHPLDYLGSDDDADLGFFPGMDIPGERKLELTHTFLRVIAERYEIVPVDSYVEVTRFSRNQPVSKLAGR